MPAVTTATPRPCVVITTYARPESLSLLLDDIERDWPREGLDIRIYDDCTPNLDPVLARRIRTSGWSYRRAAVNHGKRRWWQWWNTILTDLRGIEAPRYYVLADDMRLCDRFFERSAELWSAIEDPQKASLYLHLTAERAELGGTCWTPVPATPVGRVVHCGWTDCAAFVCDRRLFAGVDWSLYPIPEHRWQRNELLSSGVGQQLSVRAHQAGLALFRVEQSLTVHDGSPSLMNPTARLRWPMNTVRFVDGDQAVHARVRPRPRVFASLATIPTREHGLRRVVEALLPQVDAIGVYLNEYNRVPTFLDREEIVVARSQDSGVRGDAGKFFWAGATTGYQLVCDDDLDYPPDYVRRLVAGIERYGRRAIVGFHGCTLRNEVTDYHLSRRLLHFSRALGKDSPVHVLGTGVGGYHTSAISVRPEDFGTPNMADIWLALLGQRQRVPFICLRHPAGWLSELPGFRDQSTYVHARRRAAEPGMGPGPETRAVLAHGRWELQHPPSTHARSHTGSELAAGRRPAARARPELPINSVPPLVHIRVAGPEHRATLVLPEGDHITEAIRRSGTYYERDLLDAIRKSAVRGIFVDVGAHHGNHTTFFGLECGAEQVIAIEPNPQAFAGLLETIAENHLQRVVATHRVAVHPHWRHVSVTALPWRPRPGTSIRSNSGQVGISPSLRGSGIPAAPLDEILAGIHGIAVVKVDAVGLSAQVLASGRRMLQRDRPLVAAEATSHSARRALRAVLSPLGFRELDRYGWTATWLWAPVSAAGGSEALAPVAERRRSAQPG